MVRYSCRDFKKDFGEIISNLETQLNEIRENKNQACKNQKFEEAAMLRDKEKRILLEIENEKNKNTK